MHVAQLGATAVVEEVRQQALGPGATPPGTARTGGTVAAAAAPAAAIFTRILATDIAIHGVSTIWYITVATP